MKILMFAVFIFVSPGLFAQDLESWLNKAKQESEAFLAIHKNIEALQAEIRARDIVLSGQFTLQAENFTNNQDAVTFARRARSRFVDLIYDQPFSTGTLLSVSGGHDRSRFDNFGVRHTADWEVKLTQSLWRDFFGRATEYRHQGERAELLSRKANFLYTQQQWIIDLEQMYWDLVLALKEEQVRLKNIEMSKSLLSWTQQRIRRSAAEKSDELQVKALMSSRELDLVTVRNQLDSLKFKLQQVFPSVSEELIKPKDTELNRERKMVSLVASSGKMSEPRRLDVLSSQYLSRQAESQVLKTREQQKPQLDAYVSYGQNGISSEFNTAWDHAGNNRYSGTKVGVLFKVPLNRRLTSEQEKAARLTAEALRLSAQSQLRTAEWGWKDLERRIAVLKTQVEESQRLAEFQKQKVEEERRRFRIGRSTIFQLVSFEVEAAEAEIRNYRFLADLRKTESQARLFTLSEDIE